MESLDDLTLDNIDFLLGQNILELIGDRDSDLVIKPEVISELRKRKKSRKQTVSHDGIKKIICFNP